MTDQKPTGVFVRLPNDATDPQWDKAYDTVVGDEGTKKAALWDFIQIAKAIGTPVTDGELEVVGCTAPKQAETAEKGGGLILRLCPKGKGGKTWTVNLTRHDKAVALLAARDAEIVRKDKEIERLWSALEEIEMGIDALPDDNEDYSKMSAREMRRQALEVVKAEVKALKGPEA